MKVLITGATGFVGRALVARLLRDGHQLSALVRSTSRAASLLGADVALIDSQIPDTELSAVLSRYDAVVNLAGENVFSGRWTARRKRQLEDSRVALTRRLVAAMKSASPAPGVLVSASAVGYYGDRGSERVHETAGAGRGFLAQLTARWEAAALEAEEFGTRVVLPRIGVVLGSEGGALARLAPIFRFGLGGRLGHGRQAMPWIHLEDLAEVLTHALTRDDISGPVNAVAPELVTNRQLTRTLARALNRPALLPVPGFALQLMSGEAAGILLGGQFAVPEVLHQRGFPYRFPTLEGCLDDLLNGDHAPSITPSTTGKLQPWSARPQYSLAQTTYLPRSPENVFDYFSRAENLGLLTPAWTDLRITNLPERLEQGCNIDYELRLGPFRRRWRSEIAIWEPGRRFVDVQLQGPYKLWWHEHRFEPHGRHTRMEDTVHYSVGAGPLGRVVNRI